MNLKDLIHQLTDAMKAHDTVRVGVLRMLISDIRNLAIAKYGNLGESALKDTDVMDVIKKQVKTHKESIEAFGKAGRNDLVAKEQGELDILSVFVPKEMSDEELKAILTDVIATGDKSNMGLLMKAAMARIAGKANGGRVSAMLKTLLL